MPCESALYQVAGYFFKVQRVKATSFTVFFGEGKDCVDAVAERYGKFELCQTGYCLNRRDMLTQQRGNIQPYLAITSTVQERPEKKKPRNLNKLRGLYENLKFTKTILAEGVGFEPTIRLNVYRISSPAHSTSLPPFRGSVAACWQRAVP